MVTGADLLREMATWCNVNPKLIRDCEKVNLNDENSAGLRMIIEDWKDGRYDEDPEYVVTEIEELLNYYMNFNRINTDKL